MQFLKRSTSSQMNISAPIMDTGDVFPLLSAATSSWGSLSRPFSVMSYADDLSDDLPDESPAAISQYMMSDSHSGNASKLSRHNSDRRGGVSGLQKQSQISKRASMQFDENHSKNHSQGMTTSSSSLKIDSSYSKPSPISLSSSTPPKIEITIDDFLFNDFYTTTTASLSEAADEYSIIQVKADTVRAEEGPVFPGSPTKTLQSSSYSIYDDGCTQYSTPSSTITSNSCSDQSCSKSAAADNVVAASFSDASRVHGAGCTGSITQNHTTNVAIETAPASFTGTLWIGGDNKDCLTQTYIDEPVFLTEYDDDDDDLDHLVCYTKLRPRMASFVRPHTAVHGWILTFFCNQ